MIQITKDIIVDENEVCSIQREIVERYSSPSISDTSTEITFNGSVMTLKNGRKIYVPTLTPEDILALLTQPTEEKE